MVSLNWKSFAKKWGFEVMNLMYDTPLSGILELEIKMRRDGGLGSIPGKNDVNSFLTAGGYAVMDVFPDYSFPYGATVAIFKIKAKKTGKETFLFSPEDFDDHIDELGYKCLKIEIGSNDVGWLPLGSDPIWLWDVHIRCKIKIDDYCDIHPLERGIKEYLNEVGIDFWRLESDYYRDFEGKAFTTIVILRDKADETVEVVFSGAAKRARDSAAFIARSFSFCCPSTASYCDFKNGRFWDFDPTFHYFATKEQAHAFAAENFEPKQSKKDLKTDIFTRRLSTLVNELSLEDGSDTPDFVLAEYMKDCMVAFEKAIVWRASLVPSAEPKPSKKDLKFDPDYAVPPGKILEEMMEAKGININEVTVRCGADYGDIINVMNGDPIDREMAVRLASVFGTRPSFWENLEKNYRGQLKKIDAMCEEEKPTLESKDAKKLREYILGLIPGCHNCKYNRAGAKLMCHDCVLNSDGEYVRWAHKEVIKLKEAK